MAKTGAPIQPEDDWNRAGNPSMVLDELPQPFRFVNKCLDEMIMKPVWNQISKIEERKKTSEYEGFLKMATATGSMDLDHITCIAKLGREI
jgi:hypothetical protein